MRNIVVARTRGQQPDFVLTTIFKSSVNQGASNGPALRVLRWLYWKMHLRSSIEYEQNKTKNNIEVPLAVVWSQGCKGRVDDASHI